MSYIVIKLEHSSDHSLLQNPCRLNSALSAGVYHEQDVQSLNFINESDLIREVLFLLNGRSGIVFPYSSHHHRFLVSL